MRDLSEPEKAFLGGLFSGEGCIHVTVQKTKKVARSPKLIVGGIDKELVGAFKDLTGLGSVGIGSRKKGYRDGWQWQLYGKKAIRDVLEAIIPWLRESSKRQQAHLMVEFCKVEGKDAEKQLARYTLARLISQLKSI